MSKYVVVLDFEGGCRNCPFCSQLRCLALSKRIDWRYGLNEQTNEVEIKFDPWAQIDIECPLIEVKAKEPKKKKAKKKTAPKRKKKEG